MRYGCGYGFRIKIHPTISLPVVGCSLLYSVSDEICIVTYLSLPVPPARRVLCNKVMIVSSSKFSGHKYEFTAGAYDMAGDVTATAARRTG